MFAKLPVILDNRSDNTDSAFEITCQTHIVNRQ